MELPGFQAPSASPPISESTVRSTPLPLWLLTVIYSGQPFQVVINGLTGEVAGERPWSKVKLAIAITIAVLIVILAIVVYFYFHTHVHHVTRTPSHHIHKM